MRSRNQTGRIRRGVANLEDISLSGACLQTEKPVALGSPFRIHYADGTLEGKVKYCVFREIGYFLGVEFDPETQWSKQAFKPQHLLDPRQQVNRTLNRLHQEEEPIQ